MRKKKGQKTAANKNNAQKTRHRNRDLRLSLWPMTPEQALKKLMLVPKKKD